MKLKNLRKSIRVAISLVALVVGVKLMAVAGWLAEQPSDAAVIGAIVIMAATLSGFIFLMIQFWTTDFKTKTKEN